MKLIENTIDADQLPSEICDIDLDENMASCDLETVNGEQSKKEILPEKAILNKAEKLSKLTNGVCNSPLKSNGFFDDPCDDEYQLVMESSSDDSGSPKKKIYDETISAPQIVQEIEDLLGINGSNVGSDEELEKDLCILDDSEKEEDNLDDNQLLNDVFSQEVNNVSDGEENTEEKLLSISPNNVEMEKTSKIVKSTDETECDSSNMNLVYDEVEIGTEGLETTDVAGLAISATNIVQSRSDLEDKDLIVSSSCGSKLESTAATTDGVTSMENSEESLNQLNTSEDLFGSQSTNKSDESEEWMVIDSVESEEEERQSQEKTNSTESLAIENSQSERTRTNIDISAETKSIESLSTDTVSSALSKAQRKRSASIEEKHVDGKKPKLEEHNSITHQENDCIKRSSTQFVKRLSSEPANEESKRSKISESVPVVSNIILKNPKQENVGMKKQSKDDSESIKSANSEKICSENSDQIDIKIKNKGKEENEEKDKKLSIVNDKVVKPILNNTEDHGSIFISPDSPDKLTTDREEGSPNRTPANETMECSQLDEKYLNKSESRQQSECESTDSCKVTVKRSELPLNENKDVDDTEHSTVKSSIENKELSDKTETKKKSDENEGKAQVSSSSDNILNRDLSLMSHDASNTGGLGGKESKLERKDKSHFSKEVEHVKERKTVNKEKSLIVEEEERKKETKSERKDISLIKEDDKREKEMKSDRKEKSLRAEERKQGKESELEKTEKALIEKDDEKKKGKENKKERKEKPLTEEDEKQGKETKPRRTEKSLTVEEKQNVKPKSLPDKIAIASTSASKDRTDCNKSTPTMDSKNATSVDKVTKHNGQLVGEKKKTTKSPFEMLNKNMAQQTNLEKSIESVVTKGRLGSSVNLPVLKKFHQNQLRRLTRTQLEETVVLKICEAITDRSDIGQMRLRCQSLEQSNEVWKRKAAQFEKQNRELEMVLKRFMNEVSHLKKDEKNKVILPIKVTRSVGLQVVLASSVHGGLMAARNKANAELARKETMKTLPSQQQQHQQNQLLPAQAKPVEKEPVPEPQKPKSYSPPAQVPAKKPRGRPPLVTQTPTPPPTTVNSVSATPSPSAVSTPNKLHVPSSLTTKPHTTKTISTPTKDLEVIDLTDKEESQTRVKLPPTQAGGAIRVAPPTQVCFVQTSSPSTSSPPMAYIVQKTGQRQQYLVATSSPSPPRPVGTINTRQTPTLALPVFRAGGQIIPVQTTTPSAVRTSTSSMVSTARALPQAIPQTIRLQPKVPTLKHPAPLPTMPPQVVRPSYKNPPPKPQLKIAKTVNGIMLSWSMALTKDLAEMASYQLYAYQEGMQPPSTNLWKKVGDVKALPLPMACTLTQFIEGHRYHFAVRAVDVHNRIGPFSQPSTILLSK